jgi:bromodomain-containing protein 7
MVYMRELSTKELGFDLASVDGQDTDHNLDSADEVLTAAQEEEEEKRRQIRLENNPETKFEAFVDDLTPDEILQQVQGAAKAAKSKLANRKAAQRMGFLRQRKDGTTAMKIMVENENDGPEKVISLGAFTGKLKQGTGQLHCFREDRRNAAKVVKSLNYGAFSSFAPIFDSRFANLSKEESDLILRTYGDETGMQYAESLIEFSKDSPYATIMVNSLLDVLTSGEHRKTMGGLLETKRQKHEDTELRQSFPDPDHPDAFKNVKIDFGRLKSLQELGIDVGFLDEIEETMHVMEMHKQIQEHLKSNSALIDQLHQMQNERYRSILSHINKCVYLGGAKSKYAKIKKSCSLKSCGHLLGTTFVLRQGGHSIIKS